MSADALDVITPAVTGPAQAMRTALADARLNPEDVDYANAHGTGTEVNAREEIRAAKLAFGLHHLRSCPRYCKIRDEGPRRIVFGHDTSRRPARSVLNEFADRRLRRQAFAAVPSPAGATSRPGRGRGYLIGCHERRGHASNGGQRGGIRSMIY